MSEIDHEYTDEIVCPWCGYEYSDSWECSEYGEEECPDCYNPFSYNRDVSVSYSTTREKCKDSCNYELNQEKMRNPYHYNDKNWCLWKCTVCNDEITKTGPIKGEPYIIPVEDENGM